jgi:tRNA A37 threonylcarbamoyladenosine modification protein TsaB
MESKSFVRNKYKMEGYVFILKPIVDQCYEEAKIYKQRIETLEKRVEVLTKQLALVSNQLAQNVEVKKKKPEVVTIDDSDDDVYANEALAPPVSSLAPTKEEKTVVIGENATTHQEENKQVNVDLTKDRKAYMKEYQRNYRKKQKDITLNL